MQVVKQLRALAVENQTVRNVKKHALEAEKENIDPLITQALSPFRLQQP